MQLIRHVIVWLFVCIIGQGCNNNADRQASAPDTASAGREEKETPDLSFEECYQHFFKGLERITDSNSAFLLFDDGQRMTITRFFREEFMGQSSEYGKKDLDGDGSPELVIYNNTGGAHCCDEYYIFKRESETAYRFTGHLMGGNTCIDASSNDFSFSLAEMLGYFFTCYACSFGDSLPDFRNMRELRLKYSGGKLAVQPYDAASEKQNIANLAILQKQGFQRMEGLMDNGWRKEFAMNLAIWYFNHDKNWKSTRELFSRYYTFADSTKVWKEFFKVLSESGKENTF